MVTPLAVYSVLKFDGFLKVYEESKEKKDEDDEALSNKLPALNAGDQLTLKELKPEQHFTEPPPRYNEASLVKELEERGIGRPSTYATIINTIQERHSAIEHHETLHHLELGCLDDWIDVVRRRHEVDTGFVRPGWRLLRL